MKSFEEKTAITALKMAAFSILSLGIFGMPPAFALESPAFDLESPAESRWVGLAVVRDLADKFQCQMEIENFRAVTSFVGLDLPILSVVIPASELERVQELDCVESLELEFVAGPGGVAGVTN